MIIDWGNKVINIFKTDMLQVQATPTEIWELDIPDFKASLGDLLDNEVGMSYPDIFNHNPEVSVGGVTLAKVIEILPPYTVTFEDGQYAVNLVNANSNIGDRVNVNQVSIRSSNSAGLTNVREVQESAYQGVVVIDPLNGFSGTSFPTGTHAKPVNNIEDATSIANIRGLSVIIVKGLLSINHEDNLQGKTYKGENAITTAMTIASGALVGSVQFEDMLLYNSSISSNIYMKHISLSNTIGVSGYVESSTLSQNIGISSRDNTYFFDCKSACVGVETELPVIDMAEGSINIAFRNWAGPIKFINSTDIRNKICIDVASGATVIIEESCTAGVIYIRGVAEVVNNSTMVVTVVDAISQTGLNEISNAVWGSDFAVDMSSKIDNIQTGMLGSWEIKNNKLIMYNPDNSVFKEFNLLDDLGVPSSTRVFKRVSIE